MTIEELKPEALPLDPPMRVSLARDLPESLDKEALSKARAAAGALTGICGL